MATQYTPILQLALPVTGELNGTWGDVVNDNITSMVEQAIAGLATINTWAANSHTLTTADGTTDEARCAMLVASDGAGLAAAGEIICPARTKLYVLKNSSSYAITLKTSAGTGVAVPVGDTAFLFCDGTNVGACVTTIVNGHIAGNLTVDGNTVLGNATSDTITANARIASDLNPSADNTYDLGTAGNSWRNLYVDGTATIATLNVTTIDTTNLEVTNIKAKDGTTAITLADSTGVATFSATPVLNAGTINQVQFLNGSKQLVGDADFTFDGTTLSVAGLTLTNSPTLNGGTANQVQFLNASKVLSGDADLTFDGTTLTAANFTSGGTVTLSGGTANSIAYLNGSKVLTTGSALTFDGTNFGVGSTTNYGAGTATATVDASTYSALTLKVGGTRYGQLYATTSALTLDTWSGTGPIIFSINTGEQMRLTSTGLGIGTSSPADSQGFGKAVDTRGSTGAAYYSATSDNTTRAYFATYTGAGYVGTETNHPLVFRTNNAERMRLDSSGNLGLGVTPSAWGGGYTGFQLRNSFSLWAATGTSAYLSRNVVYDGTSRKYVFTGAAAEYEIGAGAHTWYTAPSGTAGNAISFTQAMTLDASGNLAVGNASSLSPSAGRIDLTINGSSSSIISFGVGGTRKGYILNDGTDLTINNESAGVTRFLDNGSERMRIDSSGNVGIGTSSPVGRLNVQNSIATVLNVSTTLATDTNDADYGMLSFRGPGGTSNTAITAYDMARISVSKSGTNPVAAGSVMKFYTTSNNTSGDPTERMRIDSSGNVGIGTSSITSGRVAIWGNGNGVANTSTNANSQLHLVTTDATVSANNAARITFNTGNGSIASAKIESVRDGLDTFQIVNTFSGPLVFGTNNTERMRIDSGGNLLVGTTTVTGGGGISLVPSASAPYVLCSGSESTNSGIGYYIYSTGVSSYRFYVGYGGTVYATNTTISAISDQRYKENVRDLDVGLNAVLALKPRVFDWKAGKGKDIKNDRGFIAQEFEQVFPDLIDKWKDPAPEGEEPYKSVRQDLIPVLVKAIQELKAELDATKAEVAALKGN